MEGLSSATQRWAQDGLAAEGVRLVHVASAFSLAHHYREFIGWRHTPKVVLD